MRRIAQLAPVALSILALVGCAADSAKDETGVNEGDFSSNQATLLDFEFDAELTTTSSFDDKKTIEGQLLYTIGHLNADNSVGRLDKLALSNIKKTQSGGVTKIAYHAKLPVAWGSKTNLPTTYRLQLPKDVSSKGLEDVHERPQGGVRRLRRARGRQRIDVVLLPPAPQRLRDQVGRDHRHRRDLEGLEREHDRQVPRVPQGLGGQPPRDRRHLRQVRGGRQGRRRRLSRASTSTSR